MALDLHQMMIRIAMPEQMTLEAASAAREHGITISIVGINLDEKGEKLARDVTDVAEGRLYVVRDVEDVDMVVLEDYATVSQL